MRVVGLRPRRRSRRLRAALIAIAAAVLAAALFGGHAPPAAAAGTKHEKRLKAAVDGVLEQEAELISFLQRLGASEADVQGLADQGQKLSDRYDRVANALAKFRNARKRFSTARESDLMLLADQLLSRTSADFKKAADPEATPELLLLALAVGEIPNAKELFVAEVEDRAAKELEEKLGARGLDLVKSKSFKEVREKALAALREKALAVAEREVIGAGLSALPSDSSGGIDPAAAVELVRDPERFFKRGLPRRAKARATEWVAEMVIGWTPSSLVLRFGGAQVLKFVGKKFKRLFVKSLDQRTRRTLTGFKASEAQLAALNKRSTLAQIAEAIDRAENRLSQIGNLKRETGRRNKLLFAQLASGEKRLRRLVAAAKRKYKVGSKPVQRDLRKKLARAANRTAKVCGEVNALRAPQCALPDDDDEGGDAAWSGNWKTTYGSGATGAIGLAVISAAEGISVFAEFGGSACGTGSEFYRGGYTVGSGAGQHVACTKSGRLVGRWTDSSSDARGGFELQLDNAKKWSGTFTTDGGSGGTWEGTFNKHFTGDGSAEGGGYDAEDPDGGIGTTG